MDRPRTGLLRLLRSREGAAVSIGVAIGAGIFRTPGEIAGFLPWGAAIIGVWLLGGLLVLLDSLVLAELGSMRPRAGGHYVYLKAAYGPRIAFLYGWSAAFLTWPASVAALAGVAAEYGGRLGLPGRPVALAVIFGPALIHMLGLRTGAITQDLLSYGKAIALLAFAVAALLLAPAGAAAAGPPVALTLAGLGFAMQRVLWSYDGYADTLFVAEEMKQPGRDLPRALLGSVALLTAVYLLLNLAFLACLTPAEMATSNLVAADAAGKLGGEPAVRVLEVLALLTVAGGASATLLSGPRISYAMARDRLLFRSFERVTQGGTPIVALTVMTLLAALYWKFETWDQIVGMTIFVIWVFVTLTTIALLVFRRREPDAPRPFRTPLYPLPPLLLLAIGLFFLGEMAVHSAMSVAKGALVMLVGLVAYEIWRIVFPESASGATPPTPPR